MTISSPQVVVACAWYNRADYIRDTIDSLMNQDFDSFEVIVVNDGSPDPRVREILDSYKDPRLRVIHQENTGFVGAIRRAIEASEAPYIAIQGAGDVSYPQRLRRQWEVLEARPDIGVVGCIITDVEIGDGFIGKERLRPILNAEPSIEELLTKGNPISHGEVMYRRMVYEKVGGYRPFFKYAQDRDLWIRMRSETCFYIIDEHLYQRRNFQVDGISTNLEKIVLQQLLSSFAIQCYHDRIQTGQDTLERYGYHGALYRKRTKRFAKLFAILSIKALGYGDSSKASHLTKISLDEKVTIYGVVSLLACFASKNKLLSYTMRYVISRISHGPRLN